MACKFVVRYLLLFCLLNVVAVWPVDAQARRMFRATGIKHITKAIHTNTRQIFKPSFTIHSRYAEGMNSASFSTDGQWFVTAGDNGAAQLWAMATGRQEKVLTPGHGGIMAITFVPGRDDLLMLNSDGLLSSWDGPAAKALWQQKVASPAGRAFLAITPFAAQGQKSRGLRFTTNTARDVAIDYGGQFALVAGLATEIKILAVDDGHLVRTLSGHHGTVTALAVAQRGLLAASGDDSGQVIIWNWQSGKIMGKWQVAGAVTSLAANKNLSLLAIGDDNGAIHLWRVAKKKEIFTIDDAHGGAVRALAFSPDLTQLTSAGEDKIIKVWTAAQGKLRASMVGHKQAINDLRYTPSGQQILSVSTDKTSRFWDVNSGEELIRLVAMRQGWAAVSPAGYFDGTLDGKLEDRLDAVAWTVGKRSFSVDGFMEGYYRPALLGRIFAGQNLSADKKTTDISAGFALPPLVRITSPAPDSLFHKRQIRVTVSAHDAGGGISAIRLYHNQKIVPEEMAKSRWDNDDDGKVLVKTYEITLADQENNFRAVGLDNERIESEAAAIAVNFQGKNPLPKSALHLVVVGINKYQNPVLNLNFGVPDAKAVESYFVSTAQDVFSGINKEQLFDRQATKRQVVKMLTSLSAVPGQDTLVLYLAGHGETVGDEWYFLPHDLGTLKDKQTIIAKGISSKELQQGLSTSKARRILLLLDACKSGAAVGAFSDFAEHRPLALLSRSTGIHIAAAATSKQYASELEDLGHGVFTFTLLQALQGRADKQPVDGKISVLEVLDYINRQMPTLVRKHHAAAQRPITNSRGIDFTLSERPIVYQ